jgi:glyoxylase-like metal-dependent hydrolase (beta-lactamase superfamily II)
VDNPENLSAPVSSAPMQAKAVGEVLSGLWRFEAEHPEWTEEEGGEDGWERSVAWWALASPNGLLLIDPLVVAWPELDTLVEKHGGCAGVVRTVHWHQRSAAEAAARYEVAVWAKPAPGGDREWPPFDRALSQGDEALDGLQAFDLERADELALWLPRQAALLFGDAMLRRPSGELRVCPDSWLQPEGGREQLRALLAELAKLPVEHVLVSHGPPVLGDGAAALRAAVRRD